jgi:hypothetical protein
MEKLPLKVVKKTVDLFEAVSPSSGRTFAKLAREAEGLAKRDPSRLLSKFNLSSFSKRSGVSKAQNISDFISKALSATFDGDISLSLLFESPALSGNTFIIKVKIYEAESDQKLKATSEFNCRKFINSMLLAGAVTGKIDWDDSKDTCVARYDSSNPRVEVKAS